MPGIQDEPMRVTMTSQLVACSVLLFSGSFLKEGGWSERSAVRQ